MTLPRPDVKVETTSDGKEWLVISREQHKAKSYEIKGATPREKVADAVRQVIDDGHTAEWLP